MDRILLERVVRAVIQYSNGQMVDMLYTWAGVNNALLHDRLTSQKEERAKADNERRRALYELIQLKENLSREKEQALEDAKAEADKILESFEEDMQKLQDEVARLSNEVERLEYERQGLRRKLDTNTEVPILHMGDEDDFYQGEIKDLVLSSLTREIKNVEPNTRRYDVLMDVIQANNYQNISENRAAQVKHLLSNYSGMTPKLKHGLEEIGFIFDEADHQKVKYYGDDRYTVIYASTPSDKGRGGKNNASITIKKAF
jgi:DNA repair exonuclease SbcCD ATPase subunit